MSLVRSIIEYGCEIWGDGMFIELEKLQISMVKQILRCGSRMTRDEVVRGELGWERHKARRDEMRLRYWAKLVRMEDDRVRKRRSATTVNDEDMVQVHKRFIVTPSACEMELSLEHMQDQDF